MNISNGFVLLLLVKAVELGILDATGINKTRTYSIKMCEVEK